MEMVLLAGLVPRHGSRQIASVLLIILYNTMKILSQNPVEEK